MNIFITLFSLISILLFYCISIYLSYKEENARITLAEKERSYKQKLYELSILKTIQERIGYSLDEEKVIDTLTGSLKGIIPYSAASFLFLTEDRLLFKTYIEEKVGNVFIEQIKNSMLASLSVLTEHPLPSYIEEVKNGVLFDEVTDPSILKSFFHIPLIISGKVVGIITVSSTKVGLYKEQDMTILYQMIHQASIAISRLKEVTEEEKRKIISFITSLTDGILMIDKNNEVSVINQTAKNILHITNEPVTIYNIFSSLSGVVDLGTKIQEAKDKNQIINEKEIIIGDKTVQMVITPVVGILEEEEYLKDNKATTPIGVTILFHDITLEKELTKMKEDFTNTVVHELRSPLTAIQGSSTIMMMDGTTEEEKQKFLTIINIQSKKLLMTISSLLDASKLENGKFVLNKEPQDINKIINEALGLFWADAKTKGVQIITDIEPTLPQAFIDPLRITQVLNNLISNSLKFTMSPGTISITAKYFKQSDTVNSPLNSGILISVSDTGIGIPKDKQGLLFQKFSQVKSSLTHTTHVGSGLGLYITKNIVEAHGGSISIVSEVNQGTTISFSIPSVPQKQEELTNTREYEKGLLLPTESFNKIVN